MGTLEPSGALLPHLSTLTAGLPLHAHHFLLRSEKGGVGGGETAVPQNVPHQIICLFPADSAVPPTTAEKMKCMERQIGSGISLLHFSSDRSGRALPVILALWSPDFPHGRPFGLPTRLSVLLAPSILQKETDLVNLQGQPFLENYSDSRRMVTVWASASSRTSAPMGMVSMGWVWQQSNSANTGKSTWPMTSCRIS